MVYSLEEMVGKVQRLLADVETEVVIWTGFCS